MKRRQISLRARVLWLFLALSVTGVIAFLFYHSIWGMVLLPISYGFIRREWLEREEKSRKQQMRAQFMQGLQVLNASLRAGFSLENAWKEVEKEGLFLYKESDRFYQEICQMNRSAQCNVPIEKLFCQAAYRLEIEEMISFGQIMEYGKKSGGNWKNIIEDTVLRMLERYETQKEIEVMIAEKKLEQHIMNVIPLGMLLFLQITSWDYINVLYESVLGVIAMTICLGLYMVAIIWSEKIMDIQV